MGLWQAPEVRPLTALLDRLQGALRHRYAIDREIGRGGMASVYLARDLRHERAVALKVLHPELAATLGADRFLREIRLAASLQHPHILPLHDSGEAEGLLYYVMPYVAGESLRERLNREQQLPVDDAVTIACEVADALSCAHEQGIVHRDIKPENILLSRGHAMVADFGIARAVSEAAGERLTETGLAVGTPAYMSPEQAAGESELGAPSDVYALGCVLYEMLGGEPPFTGPTAQAIIARRLTDTPRSIRATRETVPIHVEQAVMRALSRLPADRFRTTRDFATAVGVSPLPSVETPSPPSGGKVVRTRWLRAAAVIVAIGAFAAVYRGISRSTVVTSTADAPTPSAAVDGPIKSIAVLPFVNMSDDAANEYFSDGMTEELINALAKVGELRVTSRTSAFTLKGSKASIREIADMLKVNAVLEGSVRKAGDRLRVTAQLINVKDDSPLWSNTYERTLADVFEMQDEIARAIVDALRVRLASNSTAPLVSHSTTDVEAYTLYLQGRYHWNKRTEEGLRTGIAFFQKALERDSTYALAYTGLADSYNVQATYNFVPSINALPRARVAARTALRLDSTSAEAHAALGFVLFWHDRDWAAAERHFRMAIALNPSYPTAHHWYSLYLSDMSRQDESIDAMRRAYTLDPLSPIIGTILATRYLFADRTQQALAEIQRARVLHPDYPLGMFWSAQIRLEAGDTAGAIVDAQQAVRADSTNPMMRLGLARVYALAGRTSEARSIATEVQKSASRGSPVHMAWVYAALGDKDEAVRWLWLAYEARDGWLHNLVVDPALEPVLSDPRVRQLRKALRLP
ncbi:MAG: protein kinase domain-containing protein [Gemmatimonadaceae bacterium]